MTAPPSLADPAFFSRLEGLELRARGVVEGFLSGLHRSPFVGFSVEFASHREYAPGDDLRHVNWKLYARQRRLYVKEFDAETNLNLYLLLDVSGSMTCANGPCSKLDYAATIAAALAHLALRQRDAVGLTLFADEIVNHVPAKSKPDQFDEILRAIVATEARPRSDAGRALHQAAELCRHRGLVVLIGDLFEDVAAIADGLEHLRYRGHEVLLIQVYDPYERGLNLEGNVRFRDLETGEELTTQADGVRGDYLAALDAWRADLDRECRDRAIDRLELTTADPADAALLDYLVKRARCG